MTRVDSDGLQAFVAAFPWLRLRWRLRLRAALHVEQYAGGLVRGALGWELRERLCARPGGSTCDGDCRAPGHCSFMRLFAPEPRKDDKYGRSRTRAPAPLMVEAPPVGELRIPAGGVLEVHTVLVGPARSRVDDVAAALHGAGERGLGSDRVRFALDGGPTVVDGAGTRVVTAETAGSVVSRLPRVPRGGVRLVFETPIHLRERGEFIRSAPVPAGAIVRALCRRVGTLADHFAPSLPQPDWGAIVRATSGLAALSGRIQAYGWRRRSHVQQRSMVLGGVVGHLDWAALPEPLAPLVALGSVVHIGKNASLVGRYRLERLPPVER